MIKGTPVGTDEEVVTPGLVFTGTDPVDEAPEDPGRDVGVIAEFEDRPLMGAEEVNETLKPPPPLLEGTVDTDGILEPDGIVEIEGIEIDGIDETDGIVEIEGAEIEGIDETEGRVDVS